ncbi:hypothetical protein BC826DRAFT_972683 [Russula brevipes]|nr:hypothetical protein BC826DRAFT_972683 [Russula brevipes]
MVAQHHRTPTIRIAVLMAVGTTRTPKRRTQTVSDEDETEFLRAIQESEAVARPSPPRFEDADWESRYDATRDRCQSTQEAHNQYTSNAKPLTGYNEMSGRHVDAHACHERQSAEYADIVQRVPPEPPPLKGHSTPLSDDALSPCREVHPHHEGDLECGTPDDMEWHVDEIAAHDWDNNNQELVRVHWNLDSTIKATELLQSVKPDRPADYLHHADMRVVTHDAHQCNRCDPWLAPFAHASDFGDAISTEAEQQRDATIIGYLSAECADSCQALRAAHAMDNFRHTYDALCYQPGRTDNDNECDESLCDHSHHTLRQRKFACRHGSSPSPSRGLSRLASSPREDPVVGPLLPTHPFTSRAATNPWSSVLPCDAPVPPTPAVFAP